MPKIKDIKYKPLAVVGVASLFPDALENGDYWCNIIEKKDSIIDIPPDYWLIEDYYDPDPFAPDKTYCKKGAFLPEVDFDPSEFGIPPANLPHTDTSQLLGLVVTKKLLEDAYGMDWGNVDKSRMSVILGVGGGLELLGEMTSRLQKPVIVRILRDEGYSEDEINRLSDKILSYSKPWKESTFPGLLTNVVAGRIANRFNMKGTNCTVDAACASSFSALLLAANELYLGQSDVVITGGVDTLNNPFMFMCFSKTPALSLKNDCRPFSDKADGMMLGEGIGLIAIKRLEDAEKNGDKIYAVIKGIGSSSDGKGTSIYAPLAEGQAIALRRCYESAGYSPATVELVEAHGTGTPAGDISEFESLNKVFSEAGRSDKQWCVLGSVKSQIGHTKSTAAAAGFIKAIFAVQHKVLPPTIKVDKPDPRMDFKNSPFYLNTQSRPWLKNSAYPRRASISSFGFGGTNYHVTIEEYNGKGRHAERLRVVPSELVLLSGNNPNELIDKCKKLREQLNCGKIFSYIAKTSQDTFDANGPYKLALIAQQEKDLKEKLEKIIAEILKAPEQPVSFYNSMYYSNKKIEGKVAFLFPGQGSQYINMGSDYLMHFDEPHKIWDKIVTLNFENLKNLGNIVYPIPVFSEEEKKAQIATLTATEWAQPSIAATSLAMLTILNLLGVKADFVAGHSLGEVTALYAAGILSLEDTLKVARKRGLLMAASSNKNGVMTAVKASYDEIDGLLKKWNIPVTIANINSPDQLVLSGEESAIFEIEEKLRSEKINPHRLQVSTAFHSPLMEASFKPFREFLDSVNFSRPKISVYSNTYGATYPNNVNEIKNILAEQIISPVRFASEIENMYNDGVRIFLEVGPGSVLTNLVKQIIASDDVVVANVAKKTENEIMALWNTLAILSVNGIKLNLKNIWEGQNYALPVNSAELPKPKLVVKIKGSNYGRKYPPAAVTSQASISAKVEAKKETPLYKNEEREGMIVGESSQDLKNKVAEGKEQKELKKAAETIPAGNVNAWVKAFMDLQRQSVDAYTTFQKTMTESHLSFMRQAETSIKLLGKLANISDLGEISVEPITPEISQKVDSAVFQKESYTSYAYEEPAPYIGEGQVSDMSQGETIVSVTPFTDTAVGASGSVQALKPEMQTLPKKSMTREELEEMMFKIIVDKTGYPREILNLDMNLESDLGIDSIKRVEILSAIKDEFPELPEVDMAEVASIATLREVLEYMQKLTNSETNDNVTEAAEIAAEKKNEKLEEATLKSFTLKAVNTPASGFFTKFLSDKPVEIVNDYTGIAEALSNKLNSIGLKNSIVDRITDSGDNVIYLGALRCFNNDEDALNINKDVFLSLKKVSKVFSKDGGVFVTVQRTGGDFGLSGIGYPYVLTAGLTGLIKSAALEWPSASLKAIDIDIEGKSPDQISDIIFSELTAGGIEREVGYLADNERITLQGIPENIVESEKYLDEKSVIVVSGGARGVTAVSIIELAKQTKSRFIILGRTILEEEPNYLHNITNDADIKKAILEDAKNKGQAILPADLNNITKKIFAIREVKETLKAIEKAGAHVQYHACDIQNVDEVDRILMDVRNSCGTITGVVHGAGVIADKLIVDKTVEQFEYVFNTKIMGLFSLLKATEEEGLRLICLFSSVAGRFGNMGQCDYAAANEILNKIANYESSKRGNKCVVKSINWGPWEGGMVTPFLKKHMQKIGVPLIPLNGGAKMFCRQLFAVSVGSAEVAVGPSMDAEAFSFIEAEKSKVYYIQANKKNYPAIESHTIKEKRIVPVVLAQEWSLRAAKMTKTFLQIISCSDLTVFSGITVDDYELAGKLIKIKTTEDAKQETNEQRLVVEIFDNERVMYKSNVVMGSVPQKPSLHLKDMDMAGLKDWPISIDHAYKHDLFHGQYFRGLKKLVGVSDYAASAVITGSRVLGWPNASYISDPALIDCGLQISLLWGKRLTGNLTLPTKIGKYIPYTYGLIKGDVQCVLSGKSHSNTKTVSDIYFFDGAGNLLLELQSVEMHAVISGSLKEQEAI